MGNLLKPKKLPLNINNNQTKRIMSRTPVEVDANNDNKVLEIIKKTYYEFHRDQLNKVNDDELIERGGKRQVIDLIDENVDEVFKILKLEIQEDLNYFTSHTYDEIIDFLHVCSKCGRLPSSVLDCQICFDSLIEDLETDGNPLSIDTLRILLFEEKIHIKLAEKEEDFEKLRAICAKATEYKMITDVLDLENKEANTALATAYINSNGPAFFFLLIKLMANIPIHVKKNNKKYNFLNHVALHGKMMTFIDSEKDYLLLKILKIFQQRYPKEMVEVYFLDIDEGHLMLSLPHLLIELYQKNRDLKSKISECLMICIDLCPLCIFVECHTRVSPRWRMDLIGHMITSTHIILNVFEKIFKNLDFSKEEIDLYMSLTQFHDEPTRSILSRILR